MQRLVYSPKVQAYVQTDEGIIDISPFITGGTVSRVVNEVSTAELQIRNPDKRFTEPGNPTFRPMDAITIFASRFRERPVQLFTGYLDETPYLQLFPGICTLRASCTLKRLLYTYFDAGLTHTQAFFKKYKWTPMPDSGTIISPNQMRDQTDKSAKGDFTDGAVGNLMAAFLHEVGNWDKDSILVEEFPADAGKTVQDMVDSVSAGTKEAEEEFRDFLSRVVGDYTGGGEPTTSGGGTLDPGGSGPPPETVVSPEDVGLSMLRAGFPANERIIASGIQTVEAESAFGSANEADGWGLNFAGCCAGYWQIYLSVHNVSLRDANTLDPATKIAHGIWQNAGGCFACQPGPNPWQGGTDNGTKYLDVARRCIEAARNSEPQDPPRNI